MSKYLRISVRVWIVQKVTVLLKMKGVDHFICVLTANLKCQIMISPPKSTKNMGI